MNPVTRREFVAMSAAAVATYASSQNCISAEDRSKLAEDDRKALIAITLDLEMSREYPTRDEVEWDFQKGNLDAATKRYASEAGRLAKELGGIIHFFLVGQVLEQPNVDWLKKLHSDGHPIGNHTYDHVNIKARSLSELQSRFRRSPWLVRGKKVEEAIRENIQLTKTALKERCDAEICGFRSPGGFSGGLYERPDLQEMLLELGYTWVSTKYPDHQMGPPKTQPTAAVYAEIVARQPQAQPFVYPNGLIEVPMSPVSDVMAFRVNRWELKWFLKSIRQVVEWAIETRSVVDILVHPSCLVVEDPQFEMIRSVCEMVKQAGDRAAIVGLDVIAQRAKLRQSS